MYNKNYKAMTDKSTEKGKEMFNEMVHEIL